MNAQLKLLKSTDECVQLLDKRRMSFGSTQERMIRHTLLLVRAGKYFIRSVGKNG